MLINSSNYTEAAVSIRHTEIVMISLRDPLYETALYVGDGFNESQLEITRTDFCLMFLDVAQGKVVHGDQDDIQIVKEGLAEIWNFSDQLLKHYPPSELVSEDALRKNWELQNRCKILLEKLENGG
ncbi:hypothetical protein [Thermococcus stetteri]|uniref:hypothetical protein n=1 Tax=Thermococcus stetteri TaxID=49900 RepID=UPI001AE63C9C|nr:hypothetical protein [Thermococcus stetteri]MBP1911264.1 hypothetical protein [Thermococcus stetteri]